MSNRDGGDGEVLAFPRIQLPAPGRTAQREAGGREDREVPAAMHMTPSIPAEPEMVPPLHLTMPGVPEGVPDDVEDGAFAPPAPVDPDNPTAGDAAAAALAVLTALGIGGAAALWQAAAARRERAKKEKALAEAARLAADKAKARAADGASASRTTKGLGGGSKGGSGSKGLGGGGGSKGAGAHRSGAAAVKRQGGSDGRTPSAGSSKTAKAAKASSGEHGASRMGPWARLREARAKRAEKKAAKRAAAAEDASGKPTWKDREDGEKKSRRSLRDRVRQARAKRAAKKAAKDAAAQAEEAKDAPAKEAKASPKRPAARPAPPAKEKPALGAAAAEERPEEKQPEDVPSPDSPADEGPERPGATPPPPPPGWEWMRPPPAADQTVRVTVEQIFPEPKPRQPAAALPGGHRPSLGAGPDTQGEPPVSPTPPVPSRPANTQYGGDAELTIYDVIEADVDMAGEIGDGVAEALEAADACDRLYTKLEALAAEIADLQVPGVLAGMVLGLMDRTATVKARATAIATTLPAAAEAIGAAGANAAARHQGLADAVRDAGHARPAERQYHAE